jgi:hypothetical protein
MFIRAECRAALKAALETVADVKVVDGFDAPETVAECIEIGPPTGGVDYVVFAANAMPRDDTFSVDLLIYAGKSGQSIEAAEARAQELMNFVDAALEDPTFENLEVSSPRSSAFVFDALLGETLGPFTEPIDQGHRGFASVTVDIHTRSRTV